MEIKQNIRDHWAIKGVLNRLLQSKDWLFCFITQLQYKHIIYKKNTLNLYVPYVSISIESRQLRLLSLHEPYKNTAEFINITCTCATFK